MTTFHIFIATSLDGFIARPDGSLDWLLSRDTAGEDHGYDTFIAGIDVIVMGRGTYEKVLEFDAWPYTLPVIVLSRTLAATSVPAHRTGNVRFVDWSPEQTHALLHAEGFRRAYLDGGQLIQSFLRSGLVHDLIITRIPVLLGAGRPLFGTLDADVELVHEGSVGFASGLVQSRYRVVD